ncbi:hypothetical protein VOLCADRAFT_100280 [Volvox carteri f. nagariensis]|uniref:Uncharacterized protein n=1 Tax=Volvox carteri f. nagariensis TaxID=3068 RepID=D8UJW7_VOLCA|nr:uncharacterized protein VOLCADRAFT_100280 [Volvox carteri f. nagariensis]EFJ39983.1 hypothetical protein VOLCADRAFT_100280 [Volvox carteri f. nagariensis]|eukprot:XP_002958948.1 hypothetical protein VOLCADRAFT_100280 [Volvox carteri f. nagariensis]
MPPASSPSPVPINNFDTPEYDALQQQKTQPSGALLAQRVARDCLEEILLQFNLALHEHTAHARTLVDAVDSCLATCLDVIEMQYPAREDHPVSVISLEHSSWEQEKPPDPCTFDSWLRSALPETSPAAAGTSPRSDNWVMQQFLNKQPSIHRTMSARSTASTATALGLPAVGYAPGTTTNGNGTTGSGGRRLTGGSSRLGVSPSARSLHQSGSRRNVTKLETRKVLTPEQEHLEEQLRQELQQRKTQEEMSRRLEQRDTEERLKLASLRKELKGKDYTYDHKGEVVIINEFDPDRSPLEALSGPAYKVAVAAGNEEAARALSPKRRGAQRTTSSRSAATTGGDGGEGGAGGGIGHGARTTLSPTELRKERDRRLANDYKKVQPRTQPSALETLMPAGGVTLRGAGGASKSGPVRPAPAGITREAYAKQVAKKAMQAQTEAMGSSVTPLASGTLPRDGQHPNSSRGGAGAAAGAKVGATGASRPTVLDPLAAYGDNRYDPFAGARVRRHSGTRTTLDSMALGPSGSLGPVLGAGGGGAGGVAAAAAAPASPDVNLSLTSASDWGAVGHGRLYEAPLALPHSKPTEKQLAETVGRVDRLPRDRAPLPTLAPPLSPLKAGASRGPADRLQFHSILAE